MILFSYILRAFFKYALGSLLLGLFMFILFDFIHKSTGVFAIQHASAGSIGKYYFYQTPLQLVQLLPLASLIASLLVMITMQRSNEITIMRSSGMNIFAIALPLVAAGTLLTLLAYGLNELVVPRAALRVQHISQVEIEKGRRNSEFDHKNHWWAMEDGFYYFEGYNQADQSLHGFRQILMGEDFTLHSLVLGDEGTFDEASKTWIFPSVRKFTFATPGTVSDSQTLRAWSPPAGSIEPINFQRELRLPEELSLAELSPLIVRNAKLGRDVLELKVAWQVKIAYPLAIVLCSLMGLSFGFRSERNHETLRSIVVAMSVGISYWFLLSAFRSLGNFASLPPLVAGWLATVLLALYVGKQLVTLHRY